MHWMPFCMQVHRATLRDGTEVVVKVQRPGLEVSSLPGASLMCSLWSPLLW